MVNQMLLRLVQGDEFVFVENDELMKGPLVTGATNGRCAGPASLVLVIACVPYKVINVIAAPVCTLRKHARAWSQRQVGSCIEEVTAAEDLFVQAQDRQQHSAESDGRRGRRQALLPPPSPTWQQHDKTTAAAEELCTRR